MSYEIEINGAVTRLQLQGEGPLRTFRFDDEGEKTADCANPEPDVWSILLDGRSYEARVERGEEFVIVTVGGQRFEVRVSDPRRWKRASASGAAAGPQRITAPMPGKVVRLLVKPGDQVKTSQGVAVVEAMKMQNELKAHRAGTVGSVQVVEGASVSGGEPLLIID